jgi:hypothetical protein
VENLPWWLRPVDPEWLEPIEVKQARWLKNLRAEIEKEKANDKKRVEAIAGS